MNTDILAYNNALSDSDKTMCDRLAFLIDENLPDAENKLWHGNPVWFIDGNPVVGYAKLKNCVQLLFWSGQSFDESGLEVEGSFKAAQKRYTLIDEIDAQDVARWVKKSKSIQWDYKNIVKRKGRLERLP